MRSKDKNRDKSGVKRSRKAERKAAAKAEKAERKAALKAKKAERRANARSERRAKGSAALDSVRSYRPKLPFLHTEGQGDADFTILALVTMLVMFGIAMVFSASYYSSLNSTGSPYGYLKKQLFFALTGTILMVYCSYIDYHKLIKFNLPLMLLTVAMLVAVLAGMGTTVNGATRWLRFGPISIMPGEFAKLSAILFTAVALRKNDGMERKAKGLIPIVLYTGLLGALIIKQPNLSTALTLGGIVFAILWMAGLHWGFAAFGFAGLFGGLIGIAKFAPGSYWARRIFSFLDPFKDAKGDGFQVVQSLLALGSGGLFGKGIGKSVQKTLYLPEPQNDFILAIIGEEMGFIFVVILLIVFVALVWRTLVIALNAPDRFGMLMAGGVAAMLGLQVVLNVAVVTSSMPPTGVALPFISYGGNSLWIFMMSFGIVMNISRQIDKNKKDAVQQESEEIEKNEYRDFYEKNHNLTMNRSGR
ncbi:MAG: putative lipid II flippase FtsW [Eubacteriales bacterium]|nr:putative lipid II flippase FtsW [Eubacteriales bacterium]